MSVYAISDLHLPLGVDKPMDIFGWHDYVSKLRENWQNAVTKDDLVLIAGDISWATYLEQAQRDFEFLDQLNGIKLISKGNHDYWWSTKRKMDTFIEDNGFSNIHFLHNDSFSYRGIAVCATRGWIVPSTPDFNEDDEKVYNRELIRLRLSLEQSRVYSPKRTIAMLHYPPLEKFMDILKEFSVDIIVYGHLHGAKRQMIDTASLVAADFINFAPLKIL